MSVPSTSPAKSSNTSTATEGITKRRIAPLLAKRKQNLDRDAHVAEEKYTFVNDAGEKIHRIETDDPETGDKTIDVNVSKLLAATPSTTSNTEVLRIEAMQADEATDEELERMNPHIPSNDDVLEEVTEAIESDGLVPAWEVVDGE